MEGKVLIESKVVSSMSILHLGIHQNIFVYSVLIKNNSEHPIKLETRKWFISETNGKTSVIEGEGVVGKVPVIEPNTSFEYQSFAVTAVEFASMCGEYFFKDQKTLENFTMPIPNMVLLSKDSSVDCTNLKIN